MWRRNQLDDPIPQSSSSREAGGISIPPLHFDSGRLSNQQRTNHPSSSSSSISLDKLKTFYSQRMNDIKQSIQEQTSDHQQKRIYFMNQILNQNTYSRDEVKQIILQKDIQIDQLLEQFYEARIYDQSSKLNLINTLPQSITVTDLLQIINDLMKRLTQLPSQTKLKSVQNLIENKSVYSNKYEFQRTIDTLNTENDIVADKLRAIIQKRRGLRNKNVGQSKSKSQDKNYSNEKGKTNPQKARTQISRQIQSTLNNQRIPTFSNLNLLNNNELNESILNQILSQIKKIKIDISNINSKLDSSQLSNKEMDSLSSEYHKAVNKIQLLEQQVQQLNKQLNITHNNLNQRINLKSLDCRKDTQNELLKAMNKILLLQQHMNEATDNYNQQIERLQQKLNLKDRKIKQLTEAINTMNLINNQNKNEFEDTISNKVDQLMEEIDRLNNQLSKCDLEIKGYQLQISRMNIVIEDKNQQILDEKEFVEIQKEESQVDDNDLVRQIKKKCEDMASENEKAIVDLDRQREIKEQKLKHIYNMAAQKSSRTNRSRDKERDRDRSYSGYGDSRIKNRTQNDQGYFIESLNQKIHRKIQELKIQKEKNYVLNHQNLQLKEEMLIIRAKYQQLEDILNQKQRQKQKQRINNIALTIDSYNIEQKAQMIDCFTLLIKILSDNVQDESIITRCQNLLRCAETSREQSSNQIKDYKNLKNSPIFEKQRQYHEKLGKNEDSFPTLQYKKDKGQKGSKSNKRKNVQ